MLEATSLYNEIKSLIETAKTKAIKAVDFQRVLLYWGIGEKIYNEVQQKQNRAEYGKNLLKNLSDELTKEFGKGFSVVNLKNMRQFYLAFENRQTVFSEFTLSYSHYNKVR